MEPYYPVNDEKNNQLFRAYREAGGEGRKCDLRREAGQITNIMTWIRSSPRLWSSLTKCSEETDAGMRVEKSMSALAFPR